MGSRISWNAAKHFGAIREFSSATKVSFGAITEKRHQMKLPFVSKLRLTAFLGYAEKHQKFEKARQT